MRVECADRDRNTRAKTELRRPFRREPAGEFVRGCVSARELGAHAFKQWVDRYQKILGRHSIERLVPHPFVAHGADASWSACRVGDAAQSGRDHVAMLQSRHHPAALVRIMSKPMKKLRKSPLGG